MDEHNAIAICQLTGVAKASIPFDAYLILFMTSGSCPLAFCIFNMHMWPEIGFDFS